MRPRGSVGVGAISLATLIMLSVLFVIQPMGADAGNPAGSSLAPRPSGAFLGAPATVVSNGWERVFAAPAIEPGVPFHFYAMAWPTREIGFAVGGADWNAERPVPPYTPYNGAVYRTTDGGMTWTRVLDSAGWKIGIACADANRCWTGGKYGNAWFTQDGGTRWYKSTVYGWQGIGDDPPNPQPTPVPYLAWLRSTAASPSGAVVLFGGTDNLIERSTDGGWNFYSYWPPLSYYMATWSVTCPTDTVCYGGQTRNLILKSTDAGASWQSPSWVGGYDNWQNCLEDEFPAPDPEEKAGIQRRYYSLSFLNQYYGWAVGSCGSIYRTANGGVDGWPAQNANIAPTVQFRWVQGIDRNYAVAAGGRDPWPSDPSIVQHAAIYRTLDGESGAAHWTEI